MSRQRRKQTPGLVTARCKSCRYFWHVNEADGYMGCEYILKTGARRPCPPGDECTVYKQRRARRVKTVPRTATKWTPEAVRRLTELAGSGKPSPDIAEALSVTTLAVETKLRKLRKDSNNGKSDLP